MFEENDIKQTCSFCHKKIKSMPVQDINETLKFCDIICAKLYYDNISHFQLNIKKYNALFEDGALSKKAHEIYDKTRFVLFELLPIYKINETESLEDAKLLYESILKPTLFKSIGAY